MTNERCYRVALALMRSISQDERSARILHAHHNDHLTALSVAAHLAVVEGDLNALRTMIDTAFCLGARATFTTVSLPNNAEHDPDSLEETRALFAQARAALDAARIADKRMRGALFEAQKELAQGQIMHALAAIRRGLNG